jgi:hypothetical protein
MEQQTEYSLWFLVVCLFFQLVLFIGFKEMRKMIEVASLSMLEFCKLICTELLLTLMSLVSLHL